MLRTPGASTTPLAGSPDRTGHPSWAHSSHTPSPPIPRETPVMESRTRPDRNSVSAVRDEIRTSTDEVKDELLTDMLIHSYPQRTSQDN